MGLDQNKTTCEHQEISRNSKLFQKLKVFCEVQSFKMGKEDHFMAQMARLDGPAKFLHKSFTVQTDSISNVIGKKLSVESLMSSSTDKNKKDIKKSYAKTIEKKKKDNRLSIDENSIQAKKLKRKGAFEVNKEKVSDWDSTVQSRRLAKSYDFTNHKSEQPLQTIEESSKKFKIETPLEAEISSLLFGKPKGGSEAETDNKNEFLKDHSKDLRATRKHLAEIAKARMMARQKEAKDKYQSKIKSKRYRRALRERKQELAKEQEGAGDDNEEMAKKADLARVEERATLRHKTVSKKLRFYDQTNTKESEVRRTQNLESQKLRDKVDMNKDQDEGMDEDDQKIVNSDDEEILVKTSMIPKKKVNEKDVTTKRINPNDFIQTTEIKDFNDVESSEDEDPDEQDAFKADIATFDSGIDMEKKETENKGPKVLPGWGNWSSEVPKMKKSKQKKPPQKYKNGLVLKNSKKKLGERQLLNVPHPYKSLEDCQSELSQPVGDTFMPKTTVMKSTKPKIHVKLGAMLQA